MRTDRNAKNKHQGFGSRLSLGQVNTSGERSESIYNYYVKRVVTNVYIYILLYLKKLI